MYRVFESLDELNQDIGPSYLYNRSKLAQILFVRALKRRMEQQRLGFTGTEQVWVNASHPGAVSTDQQEQAVEAYGALGKVMVASTRPFMKEPVQQGCRPALFAATSEEIVKDKIQGAYVSETRRHILHGGYANTCCYDRSCRIRSQRSQVRRH